MLISISFKLLILSTIYLSLVKVIILAQKKKLVINKLDFKILIEQMLKIYLHNLEVKQIIATKKINKQKIFLLFCKSIKLKLDNCIIARNFATNIKYLLIKDKI